MRSKRDLIEENNALNMALSQKAKEYSDLLTRYGGALDMVMRLQILLHRSQVADTQEIVYEDM